MSVKDCPHAKGYALKAASVIAAVGAVAGSIGYFLGKRRAQAKAPALALMAKPAELGPNDMIPYVRPYLVGSERAAMDAAMATPHMQGDGPFTKRCQQYIADYIRGTGASDADQSANGAEHKSGGSSGSGDGHGAGPVVLLTASCTGALEMAALLSEIGPGDEVILPSYTFVSTVNAFVLRGATPVFVDVRASDINIDPAEVASAVTSKTKVICVVHYAGISCDMDAISEIAKKHNLLVVEDAAHAMFASDAKGRPLGSIGDFGCFSFHATKNIIMGEGGALVVNNPRYKQRAHYVWEKGTNRVDFVNGKVDKYSWIDVGGSFLPPEHSAAFLLEQLRNGREICDDRVRTWRRYWDALAPLARAGKLALPPAFAPFSLVEAEAHGTSSTSTSSSSTSSSSGSSSGSSSSGSSSATDRRQHPAHIFWALAPDAAAAQRVFALAKQARVGISGHYVPLHSAPYGVKHSRAAHSGGSGALPQTDRVHATLFRLPLWFGMTDRDVQRVVDVVVQALDGAAPAAAQAQA